MGRWTWKKKIQTHVIVDFGKQCPHFSPCHPHYSHLLCHHHRPLIPSSCCPHHSPLPPSCPHHSHLHQDRWSGLTWCLPVVLNFGVQRTSFTDFGVSNVVLQSLTVRGHWFSGQPTSSSVVWTPLYIPPHQCGHQDSDPVWTLPLPDRPATPE